MGHILYSALVYVIPFCLSERFFQSDVETSNILFDLFQLSSEVASQMQFILLCLLEAGGKVSGDFIHGADIGAGVEHENSKQNHSEHMAPHVH